MSFRARSGLAHRPGLAFNPSMSDAQAERAHCPGCGAALELQAAQAIVSCNFCGTQSKVERRLRRVEPDLERVAPPYKPRDPKEAFESWGCDRLVAGILNETDLAVRVAMARALDSWQHVHAGCMRTYVAAYVEATLQAPPELDKAMCGILGKMVCSDDLADKHCVIRAGEQYGFRLHGSRGLLFALSLGDAATVKLLLDIAEWASRNGDEAYAKEALIGVQTAIGRERTYHEVCTQILCHRLTFVSGQVAQWVMNFLKNEFDVGYRYHRNMVLEVMDACAIERPELLPGLQKAMSFARGGAKDRHDYLTRLSWLTYLRSPQARLCALETLGGPPGDVTADDLKQALDVLTPFHDNEATREKCVDAIKGMIWLGESNSIPPVVEAWLQGQGEKLHRWLKDSWNLRLNRRQ